MARVMPPSPTSATPGGATSGVKRPGPNISDFIKAKRLKAEQKQSKIATEKTATAASSSAIVAGTTIRATGNVTNQSGVQNVTPKSKEAVGDEDLTSAPVGTNRTRTRKQASVLKMNSNTSVDDQLEASTSDSNTTSTTTTAKAGINSARSRKQASANNSTIKKTLNDRPEVSTSKPDSRSTTNTTIADAPAPGSPQESSRPSFPTTPSQHILEHSPFASASDDQYIIAASRLLKGLPGRLLEIQGRVEEAKARVQSDGEELARRNRLHALEQVRLDKERQDLEDARKESERAWAMVSEDTNKKRKAMEEETARLDRLRKELEAREAEVALKKREWDAWQEGIKDREKGLNERDKLLNEQKKAHERTVEKYHRDNSTQAAKTAQEVSTVQKDLFLYSLCITNATIHSLRIFAKRSKTRKTTKNFTTPKPPPTRNSARYWREAKDEWRSF